MGSTGTLVSLEEYLNTTYEPDMEFVDGMLVRRNVGTQRHSLLQGLTYAFLLQYRHSHHITVFVECRLQVKGHYRIPDVMVLQKPFQKGRVVTDVPAIVIEIKSPDDTFDEIVDKCFEYESLGVKNILVMDPDHRRVFLFEQGDLRHLPGPSVSLCLPDGASLDFSFAEMFAELDEE